MRRITIAVAATLVLGAITIALPKLRSDVQAKPVANPPAAPPIVSGTCSNIKFTFTNKLSVNEAKIRIEKVSYYVDGVGDKSENVHTDNDCLYNRTCTTTGDNLSNAAGRDLWNFQIWYKYLATKPSVGQNWSDLVHTPTIPKADLMIHCEDNNKYNLGTVPH